MISLLIVALLICFFSFVWLGFFHRKSASRHIVGPFALPIFGNILSMGQFPHLTVGKWARKYGKIYQMYICNKRHIVLSDLDLIKKAFNHPNLSGRPMVEMWMFEDGFYGINLTSGQQWQEQRRFTVRHLKDFGFGRNLMEEMIGEEVAEFVDWIKLQNGNPVTLNRKFILATLNALWRMIAGKRFKQDDPKLNALYEQLFVSTRGANPILIFFAPKLAKLFPNLSGWNRFQGAIQGSFNFIKPEVDQHKKEFNTDKELHPRDFIDGYLAEINTKDPNSSFFGDAGYKNLAVLVFDLFMAGSVPTSMSLVWAILYLILNLDVQQKLQDEIDRVVGKSRHPSLADKPKMVFTEAFICETLRMSSFSPLGGFHEATEDTTFEGHDLPKGTAIVANQYFVHHDPQVWGDPENFRPERFIDVEGKIQLKDKIVAFSTGRRSCIGEPMARDQIFLFLTTIFQNFDVRADPSRPMPNTTPVPILDSLEPPDFYVVMKEREQQN